MVMFYIFGLFSFCELLVLLVVLVLLLCMLDLVFVDGYGISYLCWLGVVVYLGVVIDLFSIGVVKLKLVGWFVELGVEVGVYVLLQDGDE